MPLPLSSDGLHSISNNGGLIWSRAGNGAYLRVRPGVADDTGEGAASRAAWSPVRHSRREDSDRLRTREETADEVPWAG
jgi:hypothetical protein